MRHRRPRPRERGIALIMVLWVFMTLGVLALDFAQYIRDDAMAALNVSETTSGYYLAVAGMNRAMYELMQAQELGQQEGLLSDDYFGDAAGREDFHDVNEFRQSILPDGEWHQGTYGDGHYAVRIVDEGGRIAINAAGEVLLRRVVGNILVGANAAIEGLDRRQMKVIQTAVDSIMDWRDPDDLPRLEGAESDYYLSLRPSYSAKNGFFDFPEELLFVRGVTPELLYGTELMPGLAAIVSMHGRSEQINLRSITAPVLQVLLGIDAVAAEEILLIRTENPAEFVNHVRVEAGNADPALPRLLTDRPARVVRIDARGDVQRERNQARVSAIVDLESDIFDGPRVLRWMDDAPLASMYDDEPEMDVVGEEEAGE